MPITGITLRVSPHGPHPTRLVAASANNGGATAEASFVIGSTGPKSAKSAFSNWAFEMDLAVLGGTRICEKRGH